MWGVLSDERTGLSFTIFAGLRQRSYSRGTRYHIILSQIRDYPVHRLLRLARLRRRYLTSPSHGILLQASRVESYVTTDGRSASLSWNKASIWGLRPDFYYCQTVADLLIWGAFPDERTGLSFTTAAEPRQRSHSRGTRDHILLSQIRDSPNLKGQVPVFISPRNRVAQLYPQALGSIFVASYDLRFTVSVINRRHGPYRTHLLLTALL
jgi:hypothetical protein